MRLFFFIILAFALNLSLSRAEVQSSFDKFYEMATGCSYKNGELEIYLYDYSKTWLNGVRQDDENEVLTLKPGDIVVSLICADRDRFVRYKLDQLTPTRANFTRWIYSSVRTQLDESSWKYRPGSLQLTEKFELDLTQPNVLLVDYGPNKLELSWPKTLRSK